jgi:hypothetical protein
MGRHSASRDDEDEAAEAAALGDPATRSGRHARIEDALSGPAAAPASDADDDPRTGPKPRPRSAEEPLVDLDEVAVDDGPLGLIADQMTEPVQPLPVEQVTVQLPPVEQVTVQLPLVAEPPVAERRVAEPPVEPAGEPAIASSRAGRGNQSTAADLALLREHSEVRARVLAAIVVPFVLYTAVLYLIGSIGVYLIWVWIPLVTAGILSGTILDAEHRRRTGAADR